ncbi:MAG: ABC-ATPase UvrA [Planctomycetota bacterium]|nr:ABC-ATPase UvrA [Planctomycetota bacterium]
MPADGASTIRIHGARTHNLRDLSLELPLQAWTVVCGVSGSGKSSLVLDTLGAESRRRFLGTLRKAGHALEGLPRPDVDRIEGLPPAVTAGFAARRAGVRATLGTVTEVTHALRALFMRAAVPHCPSCGRPVDAASREAVTATLLAEPEGTRLVLTAPRGSGPAALEAAASEGFVRARVDGGAVERLEELDADGLAEDARVEVVVDRLVVKPDAADRFAASVDQAFALGDGRLVVLRLERSGEVHEQAYADRPWCASCDATYPPLSTSLFSFNGPLGACPTCEGRGGDESAPCSACDDTRLAPYPRAARLEGETLPALEALSVDDLRTWFAELSLPDALEALTRPARQDAEARLGFLAEVGLGYLAPARAADSLSGGELRRARLASACAARMSGLLYLLDEPTAGLHPADRPALRERLRALVGDGNTVVCVEHDLEMLRHADWMVELGPAAGAQGGRLLACGPAAEVLEAAEAPTAVALARDPDPARTAPREDGPWIDVAGARLRNLDGVDARLPARGLTAVTGVSGAGKSTFALDVLAPAARAALEGEALPATLVRLEGMDAFDRVVRAGAAAPRHPRATAGSVLQVLTPLRQLFAQTLEARARGWSPSWFSTHVDGGRCSACKGTGRRTVVLRDLPEHRIPCDVCGGSRFRADIERVRVKGYSMPDVLRITIEEGARVFRDLPRVRGPLQAAADVGLGYVPLGETTARLSGGEALRLRLAAALGRGGRTRTLYVLDEPCAGLHPNDVQHLVGVLLRLTERGNAIVAVEHHLDLIRAADHVIELGPGPGADGGRVVYAGPPAGLAACPGAATAPFL